MRGPSVAVSNGTEDLGNRKGNAALHGITSTNIHSIAYVAVLVSLTLPLTAHYSLTHLQVRFTLSSQHILTIGGTAGKWQYGKFYREIVGMCELMPAVQRRALLRWWDESVHLFAHSFLRLTYLMQ